MRNFQDKVYGREKDDLYSQPLMDNLYIAFITTPRDISHDLVSLERSRSGKTIHKANAKPRGLVNIVK